MKGHSNPNVNHINLNNLLSSNSANDILKMFSQNFAPLEKSHSDNTAIERFERSIVTRNEKSPARSTSAKSTKKDHNFKVVVRVRPQLPNELGMSS